MEWILGVVIGLSFLAALLGGLDGLNILHSRPRWRWMLWLEGRSVVVGPKGNREK